MWGSPPAKPAHACSPTSVRILGRGSSSVAGVRSTPCHGTPAAAVVCSGQAPLSLAYVGVGIYSSKTFLIRMRESSERCIAARLSAQNKKRIGEDADPLKNKRRQATKPERESPFASLPLGVFALKPKAHRPSFLLGRRLTLWRLDPGSSAACGQAAASLPAAHSG